MLTGPQPALTPSPGGPATPPSPALQRVRRPERVCDAALTGTTRRWLLQLPARRRPLRLCLSYPRVANRIAWVWADAEVSAQVLVDLLEDSRGGRQGFPPSVTRELRRLQDFNRQQRRETQPEGALQMAGRFFGVM
jgi:hypothetical protein